MGYKLKDGSIVVDEDGNLNVLQGASLYVAGEMYANSLFHTPTVDQTYWLTNFSGEPDDKANNFFDGSIGFKNIFADAQVPLHNGSEYGYLAGGDVLGNHLYVLPAIQPSTSPLLGTLIHPVSGGGYDRIFQNTTPPFSPYINITPFSFRSPAPHNFIIPTVGHNTISRFPFAITSAPGVEAVGELAHTRTDPTGPRGSTNSQVHGSALSSGVDGYYVGGYSVYESTTLSSNTEPGFQHHAEIIGTVSRYPFSSNVPATDAGELFQDGYALTGHSSKGNNAGYVVSMRRSSGENVQKFAFASSGTTTVNFIPIDGTPTGAVGAGPSGNNPKQWQLGWTTVDRAYMLGNYPQPTPAPFPNKRASGFSFASETDLGELMNIGDDYFPYGGGKFHGGIAIQSFSHGYMIGDNNWPGSSTSYNDMDGYKFPFANLTKLAIDVTVNPTNPSDYAESPYGIQGTPALFGTGLSSETHGFVGTHDQDMSISPTSTYTEKLHKFPFANDNLYTDIYERAVNYDETGEHDIGVRSGMGTSSTVK